MRKRLHPMRPSTVALLALTLAGSASAAVEMPLGELPADKLTALGPILQHGELALLESLKNGRMAQVTVIALIAAPPSVVRDALATPERYKEFGHNLTRADVRRLPDGSIDYDFALDLKVITLDNNHKMWVRADGSIEIKDRGPNDHTNYRWRFYAVAGGTIAVQYGFTDVFNANTYIRKLVESAPTMEHGLALSTQLFYVRAIKERAEALAAKGPKGSFPPLDPTAKSPGFRFLLERGRVAVIRSRPDGHLADISLLDTIYAPRARVEAVIADPRQYRTFVDGVKKSEVISVGGEGGELQFRTEFELSVLTWSTRFAMRRSDGGIDIAGLSGDLRNSRYRWDLTARGEKETLAVLRASQDLSTASPILLGSLFRREPLFEHGVAVALGLVHLVGVRGRAEGWK
ncbi:MAG: hypothetical protein EXR72_20875 [Myxococcales bacterium]|nr:hypothetical protein [Myxococcales bacterium]